MSCCGQKRAQLARLQHPAPSSQSEPRASVAARRPRVFIYIGDSSTTIPGAASGTLYRFEHPGASVEVAYEDSFAMMAERDVRPQL